jgi:hypothetical protein
MICEESFSALLFACSFPLFVVDGMSSGGTGCYCLSFVVQVRLKLHTTKGRWKIWMCMDWLVRELVTNT